MEKHGGVNRIRRIIGQMQGELYGERSFGAGACKDEA